VTCLKLTEIFPFLVGIICIIFVIIYTYILRNLEAAIKHCGLKRTNKVYREISSCLGKVKERKKKKKSREKHREKPQKKNRHVTDFATFST